MAEGCPGGTMEDHVRALGVPPAEMVREQLRKLQRDDKRGTEAQAMEKNEKAVRKAVKAASASASTSTYALPDLGARGTG